MAKDLPGFITEIKETFPQEILEIHRPVDPNNFDVSAILQHLENKGQFPMVLFHAPKNLRGEASSFPVVVNLFAQRERSAIALGFPPEQSQMPLSLEFARREQLRLMPQVVSPLEAPVKEVVEMGEDADVRKFPGVRQHHMNLGAYFTMLVVVKDPDEGFYEASFIKTYPKAPRRMGISVTSPHVSRIRQKYEARGLPTPIINILGHHPAFSLGTLSATPFGNNDYETIGAFMGEPLRLVASETWGDDFLVPADAEIVIEGELELGVMEILQPYGEVTRHYQPQSLKPVMRVTSITHRRHAIMEDVFCGHVGHWILGAIPKEGSVYNSVRKKFADVTAVHIPNSGCGRLSCYVAIKKSHEGEPKWVALETLTVNREFQWVVVVDDFIDVFNEQDVMWAFFTTVDPSRDITVIENIVPTPPPVTARSSSMPPSPWIALSRSPSRCRRRP
ncbi:MAG: UbiD family decarboxylase [Chloroflexi bacterium]|nr:UbiD family decarboxylase [Chloroflexota bacterium]